MHRLLYALVLGIVGAGIVHIVVLLLIPQYSEQDAWTLISEAGPAYSMVQLNKSSAGESVLSDADPMFAVAACRFDLSDGIVQITSEGLVPFWSLSVFDRRGSNIYSLNDRSATDGSLDVIIATPAQLLGLRKTLPEQFEQSVVIEAETREGIAVLRSFVPDSTWRPIVQRHLDAATCDLATEAAASE
jgi:uncharacterized membrane protein